MYDCHTLDDYLGKYGRLLGKQAEDSMRPVHVPGRDGPEVAPLLRRPFEPQAHVIAAGAKVLRNRHKSLFVVGEMGTGKTLMAQGIAQTVAGMKGMAGYRCLVLCPPQLVGKWEREILETVPRAVVHRLDQWDAALKLHGRLAYYCRDGRKNRPVKRYREPEGPEFYVISREQAKRMPKWKPAYVRRRGEEFLRCPRCGGRLVKARGGGGADDAGAGASLAPKDLGKRRTGCPACGERLWQWTGSPRRYAPATIIHKKMRNFFDFLVCDEVHEEKSADSNQGNAFGELAASARRCLALTGTLVGGYADHVRPLLLRTSPRSLVREGFGWHNETAFVEEYGRIETKVVEREGSVTSNRQGKGRTRTRTKRPRPGIMPTLFGRHLMANAVFLGLDEVAANLPPLEESVVEVDMDAELAPCYEGVQKTMEGVVREMVVRGDRRFLGAMLQTLLAYPDHPFGWDQAGYWETNGLGRPIFIPVVQPPNLSAATVRSKEKKLLDIIRGEVSQGRQCWVFVTMTGGKDVAERLRQMLAGGGYRVDVLRASVEPKRREGWIAEHGPNAQVVISHPRLVETGLDLFGKNGGYNFSTLVFYQTGYNLFTLRQASRRSWRIGQTLPCRVYYLFYAGTMQSRAMTLMGRKLFAAQTVEGKFSSDGLVAMGGDDGIEMALAKSLAERMDEGSPARAWQRVGVRGHDAGRDMHAAGFVRGAGGREGQTGLLLPELFQDADADAASECRQEPAA